MIFQVKLSHLMSTYMSMETSRRSVDSSIVTVQILPKSAACWWRAAAWLVLVRARSGVLGQWHREYHHKTGTG